MPICNCHIQYSLPAPVSVDVLLNDSDMVKVPSLLLASIQAE